MDLVWALGSVVGFVWIAGRLGVVRRAHEAIECARESLVVLSDPSLGDDLKESRMRVASVRMFVLFGYIAAGGALAFAGPMVMLWLVDVSGVGSLGSTLRLLMRPEFLAATVLVGAALVWLSRRRAA